MHTRDGATLKFTPDPRFLSDLSRRHPQFLRVLSNLTPARTKSRGALQFDNSVMKSAHTWLAPNQPVRFGSVVKTFRD